MLSKRLLPEVPDAEVPAKLMRTTKFGLLLIPAMEEKSSVTISKAGSAFGLKVLTARLLLL
jgi:hypothetical protein